MPPHVKCDRYGYYYRNESAGEYTRLKDERGKRLRPEASRAAVYAAVDRLAASAAVDVNYVIKQYLGSPQFRALKPATRRDYEHYAKKIGAVFGSMAPDTVTSVHVQLFVDKRGAQHPVAANHEKGFLSLIFNWGKSRGFVNIANPCAPVKKLKTKSRARAPDDLADYLPFYTWLIERGHVMHAGAMEIAYLCGARQQDVLRLQEHRPFRPKGDDCYITNDGIHIWQRKTGRVQLKRWTPRLRAAVDMVRNNKKQRDITCHYLICTRAGDRYTREGFNSIWSREQRAAALAGVISRFRFHDLKHKGVTDFEGDKRQFSDHATDAMANHYNHAASATDTVQKPMPGK